MPPEATLKAPPVIVQDFVVRAGSQTAGDFADPIETDGKAPASPPTPETPLRVRFWFGRAVRGQISFCNWQAGIESAVLPELREQVNMPARGGLQPPCADRPSRGPRRRLEPALCRSGIGATLRAWRSTRCSRSSGRGSARRPRASSKRAWCAKIDAVSSLSRAQCVRARDVRFAAVRASARSHSA